MKFKLEQKVTFEGHTVIIWDYSSRHKEYEVKLENGKTVRGIDESELKASNN